jgi:hypothetical protein
MTLAKKNRFNLLVGLVLITLVTLPTFVIVMSDASQPTFLPVNAWLWPTLLFVLLGGWFVALFGLMRQVHWGHFLWSQTTLSFLVLVIYVGRSRTDRVYARFGPDPDAFVQGPPEADWSRVLLLFIVWMIVGFLPLVLRSLWKRYKARHSSSNEGGAGVQ